MRCCSYLSEKWSTWRSGVSWNLSLLPSVIPFISSFFSSTLSLYRYCNRISLLLEQTRGCMHAELTKILVSVTNYYSVLFHSPEAGSFYVSSQTRLQLSSCLTLRLFLRQSTNFQTRMSQNYATIWNNLLEFRNQNYLNLIFILKLIVAWYEHRCVYDGIISSPPERTLVERKDLILSRAHIPQGV
jgi:hypothetical protein